MQDKQTNKNQLEDYFHASANRGSMYSRNEIEQLISSGKTVNNRKAKSKTNLIKTLIIMTLLTATLAALIWMSNPVQEKDLPNQNNENSGTSELEVVENYNSVEKKDIKDENNNSVSTKEKSGINYDSGKADKATKMKIITYENKNINLSFETGQNNLIEEKAEKENQLNATENKTIEILKVTDTEKVKDNKQIKLEGVKLLEFTRDELSMIGVYLQGDSVCLKRAINDLCFSMKGLSFKRHQEEVENNKFIIPDLITDDLGLRWRINTIREEDMKGLISTTAEGKTQVVIEKASQVSENRILKSINTYIPVLVRTGVHYSAQDSIEKRWRPDLILWFRPTEEFRNLLPKELRKKIEKEYNQLIKQPEKSETQHHLIVNILKFADQL